MFSFVLENEYNVAMGMCCASIWFGLVWFALPSQLNRNGTHMFEVKGRERNRSTLAQRTLTNTQTQRAYFFSAAGDGDVNVCLLNT